MRRLRFMLVLVLAVSAFGVACQSADDTAREAFRTRLRRDAHLTPDELRTLYQEIGRAISGKALLIHQGAVTKPPDEQQRVFVLGLLSDPAAVYDGGVRTGGSETWRGLSAGATPLTSEVEATQTLWIDTETFMPRRFEFAYAMPGLGDYNWDLTFEK